MMTLEIPLSEPLHRELKAWALRENFSMEELAAEAVAEKLSALAQLAYLNERSARGSRDKFLEVLAKVPSTPPVPPDSPAK